MDFVNYSFRDFVLPLFDTFNLQSLRIESQRIFAVKEFVTEKFIKMKD